jgi:hypothetical protein
MKGMNFKEIMSVRTNKSKFIKCEIEEDDFESKKRIVLSLLIFSGNKKLIPVL